MAIGSYITEVPYLLAGQRGYYITPNKTSTIVDSGGKISLVKDQFGRNNNLDQPTGANQPGTGGNINGLNAMTFNGTDQLINVPSAIPALTNGGFTLFLVSKANNIPSVTRFAFGTSGTPRVYIFAAGTTGFISGTFGDGTPLTLTSSIVCTDTCVTMLRYDGTTDTFSMKVNNDTMQTGTKSTTLTPANTCLGSLNRVVTANMWEGSIGDVLLYTYAITDSDIYDVMQGLGAKWGATV